MEIWELVAREEIRELIASYNAHGDAGRLTAMLELFAEDAVFEIENRPALVGRQAIRELMTSAGRDFVAFALSSGLAPGARVVHHFTSTVTITVTSPSEARADLYYLAVTPQGIDHWGRYRDEYRTVEGTWKIARRQEWTDGYTPGGMGAQVVERDG